MGMGKAKGEGKGKGKGSVAGHAQPHPVNINRVESSRPLGIALLAGFLVSATASAHQDAVDDRPRFLTSREAAVLPLPDEDDAFFFVVFGDRTGGPADGVEVLADAVRDVNLLQPDLVMTVGDLVEGYNQTDEWMVQMREFKGIMDGLACPWYPVAGNHDIYWRGPDRPPGEHERNYETHFGPLWYAFEHKGCWFIVLYSDEGDVITGRKSFEQPPSQVMSDEQLSWLRGVLVQAADAPHVFVFLHHPRWLGGGYGRDWHRVHRVLADAGNVRAVFAGHIHRMRYDGPRDGIEYVTLATTGGSQSELSPQAGYLHHFHIVTVRRDRIGLAALPVGEILDVRAITGKVSDDAQRLALTEARLEPLVVAADGSVDGELRASFANPVDRPIEITVRVDNADSRWSVAPDHRHARIEPGDSCDLLFRMRRQPSALDATFRIPRLVRHIDYLGPGFRFSIPERPAALPLQPRLEARRVPDGEHVLVVDGDRGHLLVRSAQVPLPQGPFTLECWFNAHAFGPRTGLITKTENSEYGLFVSNGIPAFSVFLGDRYVEASPDAPLLETGTWHHVAGVYDGRESRLYLDGELVASFARSGRRRTNDLPLMIGADVNGRSMAVSHFRGRIDGVRLSDVARYDGERFHPVRRHGADDDTLLLLDMDAAYGPWVYDGSGREAHPLVRNATIEAE